MSCIISTVTLQPGQSFVLPAGATIIGATDSGSITSVNDCADLTAIEDFTCYGVTYGNALQDGGQDSVYKTVNIYGIRADNIEYPFIAPITTGTGLTDIVNALNETPYGGLFTTVQTSFSFNSIRGRVTYVSFKTLPSFANDLYFYGIASGQIFDDAPPASEGSSGSFPVEFKVIPYADLIAQGGTAPYPLCT